MAYWWRRALFTLRECNNKVADWWRRAQFSFWCCFEQCSFDFETLSQDGWLMKKSKIYLQALSQQVDFYFETLSQQGGSLMKKSICHNNCWRSALFNFTHCQKRWQIAEEEQLLKWYEGQFSKYAVLHHWNNVTTKWLTGGEEHLLPSHAVTTNSYFGPTSILTGEEEPFSPQETAITRQNLNLSNSDEMCQNEVAHWWRRAFFKFRRVSHLVMTGCQFKSCSSSAVCHLVLTPWLVKHPVNARWLTNRNLKNAVLHYSSLQLSHLVMTIFVATMWLRGEECSVPISADSICHNSCWRSVLFIFTHCQNRWQLSKWYWRAVFKFWS